MAPLQAHWSISKNHPTDDGLIFRPNGSHSLHAMCDADFAGTLNKDYANQHSIALSRTGFIIPYSGYPIVWHSKLQTEIALSTCEAEYTILSQCACALITLRPIIDNISTVFKPKKINTPLCRGPSPSHCLTLLGKFVILEDNAACIAQPQRR